MKTEDYVLESNKIVLFITTFCNEGQIRELIDFLAEAKRDCDAAEYDPEPDLPSFPELLRYVLSSLHWKMHEIDKENYHKQSEQEQV